MSKYDARGVTWGRGEERLGGRQGRRRRRRGDLTYPSCTTIAEETKKGVRGGGERKTLRREGEECG